MAGRVLWNRLLYYWLFIIGNKSIEIRIFNNDVKFHKLMFQSLYNIFSWPHLLHSFEKLPFKIVPQMLYIAGNYKLHGSYFIPSFMKFKNSNDKYCKKIASTSAQTQVSILLFYSLVWFFSLRDYAITNNKDATIRRNHDCQLPW